MIHRAAIDQLGIDRQKASFDKLTGSYRHCCVQYDGLAIDEDSWEIENCLCFEGEKFNATKKRMGRLRELAHSLSEKGYSRLYPTGDGKFVGLRPMAFTMGLFVGVDAAGYSHRYCYDNLLEAESNLNDWARNKYKDEPKGYIKRMPEIKSKIERTKTSRGILQCPACGSLSFNLGPLASLSTNITCTSCGATWNYTADWGTLEPINDIARASQKESDDV